jgi:hypothetical protein
LRVPRTDLLQENQLRNARCARKNCTPNVVLNTNPEGVAPEQEYFCRPARLVSLARRAAMGCGGLVKLRFARGRRAGELAFRRSHLYISTILETWN